MRYIGTDYEKDMAEIGKSEATKRWWKVCPHTLISVRAEVMPRLQALVLVRKGK